MVAKLAAARDFIKTNPGQQFDKSFLRGIQLFEMIEGEIK
jgi:acyl carrier protein phosphodiesterase